MLNTINCSEDEMNEVNTHNPPASLVPRLHAIKLIALTKSEIVNAPDIISKAQLIRSDLHIMLSQLLFGDHLAADYLICHLLSMMYVFYSLIIFFLILNFHVILFFIIFLDI